MNHIPYGSINQFRHVIKEVKDTYTLKHPILTFRGTVKLHGTNASIIVGKSLITQSKNRIITPENDNYGFAKWVKDYELILQKNIYDKLPECVDSNNTYILYGEWFGKGIAKGTAISEVSKQFYLFGVKVVLPDGTHYWLKDYPNLNIPNIVQSAKFIWTKDVEIDFSNPELIQNKLISYTNEVEKECPVGKYLGILGIGEGIVWEHITDIGVRYTFKVKGQKHSISKVKKLASVDVETLNSIAQFTEYALTEHRLNQGIIETDNTTFDINKLGDFLSWINKDIIKEESDTLNRNTLTYKLVSKSISNNARSWFISKTMGI